VNAVAEPRVPARATSGKGVTQEAERACGGRRTVDRRIVAFWKRFFTDPAAPSSWKPEIVEVAACLRGRLGAILTTSKRDDVRGKSALEFPLCSQAFSHAASVGRSDLRVLLMVLVVDRGSGCIGPNEIGLVASCPGAGTTDRGHESG
jgi:hypothetical protein